jgi:tRNA(fMet)-specific endonuclease VapC
MILIDTDICIEILRGNTKLINKRSHINDDISVSFMTVGELLYGAYNSTKIDHNVSIVEEFLLSVSILNSDFNIMKTFGLIKTELKKDNILLPDADLIIAATAITKCDLLVSGNIKHFKRIKNLNIDNWSD